MAIYDRASDKLVYPALSAVDISGALAVTIVYEGTTAPTVSESSDGETFTTATDIVTYQGSEGGAIAYIGYCDYVQTSAGFVVKEQILHAPVA